MANESTEPQLLEEKSKRKTKSSKGSGTGALRFFEEPDPAVIYSNNSSTLYGIVRHFQLEPMATETMRSICRTLASVVPIAGYRRYSRLVCLRAVLENIQNAEPGKLRTETTLSGLRQEEIFCLLLRDRFFFSCSEIAAVMETSEGSIRTRLERARARIFSEEASERAPASHLHSSSGHACIAVREAIEDWLPEATSTDSPKTSPVQAPQELLNQLENCPKCKQAVRSRIASLEFFRQSPVYAVPEELRKFPVVPMLAPDGRRVIFNWAASPWYIKAMIEGLVATAVVVGVVLFVPKLKNIYEFWLERRFDLYSVAELAIGLGGHSDASPGPAVTDTAQQQKEQSAGSGETPSFSPLPRADKFTVKVKSEFVGRDSENLTPERFARVYVKIDEPQEIKNQVLQILGTVPFVSADPETPAGSALPGGILFDVFVPQKSYKAIINEIGKLGDSQVLIARSRQRGRVGQARLKIWLQRI